MKTKRNAIILPEITEAQRKLLKLSASNDQRVAYAAQREIALAFQVPLRQGILDGDITDGLFTPMRFEPGQVIEFPLDFLVPGTEDEYVAYTIPNYGRIPERHIEGDYVTIPTYDVGASIDWAIKFGRDARWDVASRAMALLENMFVRKINSDAWRSIIAAGVDRNVLVFDSTAPAGFFTKRLVTLMQTAMRRRGGGNLASLNQIKLTDLYLSPEAMEDIRTWDLTQIDDVTRREIFLADSDAALPEIFGIRLHQLDELGDGYTFQTYFTSLGGTLASGDTELVIGLDLTDRAGGSFVMPIRSPLELFNDEALHRQRRQGWYGWQEHGFGILDNRRIIFGSF